MIGKKDITGIILAGGKSSRMGTDKGLIHLDGRLFVECSISAVKPLVSEIFIISNNPKYDLLKLVRFNDIMPNAGPLAGIFTGLQHSNTDYNLVLSCDVPIIKTEVLELLIAAQDGAYDVVQLVSNGRCMPLIALYHKRCKKIFHELLKTDERRLHGALNHCKVKDVVVDPAMEMFTANINTPEELNSLAHGIKN